MLLILAFAARSWLVLSSFSWAAVNFSWAEAGAIIEFPLLKLLPDACPCEFALLLLWCKPGYRYTTIQIQEKSINIFAHTMYLNGGGELIFVTPWSNIFSVYESWCAEKPLCIVIEVDSLKRELLQSLIVSREYTYIEEIKSLLISSVCCFAFFFFVQRARASAKLSVKCNIYFGKG